MFVAMAMKQLPQLSPELGSTEDAIHHKIERVITMHQYGNTHVEKHRHGNRLSDDWIVDRHVHHYGDVGSDEQHADGNQHGGHAGLSLVVSGHVQRVSSGFPGLHDIPYHRDILDQNNDPRNDGTKAAINPGPNVKPESSVLVTVMALLHQSDVTIGMNVAYLVQLDGEDDVEVYQEERYANKQQRQKKSPSAA